MDRRLIHGRTQHVRLTVLFFLAAASNRHAAVARSLLRLVLFIVIFGDTCYLWNTQGLNKNILIIIIIVMCLYLQLRHT